MSAPQTKYLEIINAIDQHFRNDPFAIWQIRTHINCDPKQIRKILVQLNQLRILVHHKISFNDRNWEIRHKDKWDVNSVVKTYEGFWMLQKLQRSVKK